MKRIIVLIGLIFIITGCGNHVAKEDNLISKMTEKTMLTGGTQSSDIAEETIDEVIPEDIIVKNEIDKEKKENVVVNEIPSISEEAVNDTFDYQIHKGRIDCMDIDECMNISLPIQFELKNVIDSVFYLEVKDDSNASLGYFIDYDFKNYQYDDYDTCLQKNEYLKNKLSDRIKRSDCTIDGLLIIESDYQGDNDD